MLIWRGRIYLLLKTIHLKIKLIKFVNKFFERHHYSTCKNIFYNNKDRVKCAKFVAFTPKYRIFHIGRGFVSQLSQN